MKKLQILVTIAFVISIMSFSSFALPEAGSHTENNVEKNNTNCDKCHKDPLKRLEERKEKIQQDLKDGKITKEKADELSSKIDQRIAKINEFNSLTLPEKKQHLTKKFNSYIEKQVKDGRITKEEGENMLSDFSKQLENWDGKEPPKLIHKMKKEKE